MAVTIAPRLLARLHYEKLVLAAGTGVFGLAHYLKMGTKKEPAEGKKLRIR